MTQLDLASAIVPNRSVDKSDRVRVLAKCADILARLQTGPATNRELNQIAFSYRQRISELRQAGYVIDCAKGEAGLATYTLGQEK